MSKGCSYDSLPIDWQAGKHARLVTFCLLLIIVLSRGDTVSAQSQTGWSPRQRIPGIADVAEPPYLVADRNKTVHAFHSMPVGGDQTDRSIVYSKWSVQQGWTPPVDIILPFGGNLAFVQGAFLDKAGWMHIIFYCCDDQKPNIYYSRAPVNRADQAPAWSEPMLVGQEARQPHSAALAGDDRGDLFVLFSGGLEGKGVYAVASHDAGETWSSAVPVFLTYDDKLFPINIGMQLDLEGTLHAVWVINRPDGNGDAIYYARLESSQGTWSEPIVLAKANEADRRLTGEVVDRVYSPTVTRYGNELIAIYTICEPCELRVRRSYDLGRTWADAAYEIPSRGDYGPPSFVTDANDILRLLRVDRLRGNTLWCFTQQGHNWSEPEPVVPLSENVYPKGDPQQHAPYNVRGVVSQGNVLLATWMSDPGSGNAQNGIWYSYKVLDAPELPLIPLPTMQAAALPTAISGTPTVIATSPPPTSTRPSAFQSAELGNRTSYSIPDPARFLALGTAPVVVFLISVVIALRLRARH